MVSNFCTTSTSDAARPLTVKPPLPGNFQFTSLGVLCC